MKYFNYWLAKILHTRHSEAFFPETPYHQEAFDVDGKLEHSKFTSYVDNETKGPTWECSTALCKLPPTNELTTKLQEVYTSIGSCTPEQARHYIHHIDDCTKPDSHDA